MTSAYLHRMGFKASSVAICAILIGIIQLSPSAQAGPCTVSETTVAYMEVVCTFTCTNSGNAVVSVSTTEPALVYGSVSCRVSSHSDNCGWAVSCTAQVTEEIGDGRCVGAVSRAADFSFDCTFSGAGGVLVKYPRPPPCGGYMVKDRPNGLGSEDAACPGVPALSQTGVVILAGVLLTSGIFLVRRRKG
jgi:hypothetical protein